MAINQTVPDDTPEGTDTLRPTPPPRAMAVTIIGIPLALANLKMIPVSLVPLGKEIVPVDSLKAATV